MWNRTIRRRRTGRHTDAGMTLPELLIVVSFMGLLAAVLSAAIVVTYRTVDGTEGRANVARAEQSIDTWLPADLTSTDVTDLSLPAVDIDPAASPCGGGDTCGSIDMSGANALQLAWKTTIPGAPPVEVITRVQYQYIQVGDEWQIQRVECVGGSACTMNVVLHDLKPPPNPDTFNPDTDRPVWVMDVAAPNDPAALELSDNARRIVVTIDGGGAAEGAGGGQNSVNLTAGGTTTEEIEADEFTVPSFVRARSRCGGPVTLIVDDSNSVGSAVSSVVEPGVEAFVESFRRTPTQVQIVPFAYYASSIGPDWHNYYDMTDDAQVDSLKSQVAPTLDSSGGTNWEDAFFRALKNEDGSTASTLPNRIVFFTDGIPTMDRTTPYASGKGPPSPSGYYRTGDEAHYNDGPYDRSVGWRDADRNRFNQESWDRTDVILDQHRGIDLIFVGVGASLDENISTGGKPWPTGRWVYDPAVYQDHTTPPGPTVTKKNWETIAYLLANAPSGQVPAIYDSGSGEYTNPETADFYLQSDFDATAFAAAMKAAALKDCGGTLTIQTRYVGGGNVPDEFVYENVEYRDDTGTPVEAEARRVTTSASFRTGTFDFEIPSTSSHFTVDVVPQELQTLTGFTFQGWSCRAGATQKTGGDMVSIPIDGSSYEGFSVTVKANEAVSCIMEVS